VSSLGRVQFSVALSAEFSVAILLAMSRIDAIWAIIRAGSQHNPTKYVSVLRYIFCDTVQQIANDIYGKSVDISVCYMPMDRMTTIGVTCYFVFFLLPHSVQPAFITRAGAHDEHKLSVVFVHMFPPQSSDHNVVQTMSIPRHSVYH